MIEHGWWGWGAGQCRGDSVSRKNNMPEVLTMKSYQPGPKDFNSTQFIPDQYHPQQTCDGDKVPGSQVLPMAMSWTLSLSPP